MDEDSLEELKSQSKDSNWEGLIARKDAHYSPGRSKNMLKIKRKVGFIKLNIDLGILFIKFYTVNVYLREVT